MAKDFKKAGSAKIFGQVAKESAEKARVITVKMISDEKLVDYFNNQEDVEDTRDLEESMEQLGFIDPIEVTDFFHKDDKNGMVTIVSGHRRRRAGRKKGINTFPCIVKHFVKEEDVNNYVLFANAQRDSAKDPLLFCKKYKGHEEYLRSIGFEGGLREEVAKRLGISVQQADRYNSMNKVILPVWDMVRDEVVGMSSVLPMATYTPDEQVEILTMLEERLNEGLSLTREAVKEIVNAYKNGKRTYKEVVRSNEQSREENVRKDLPLDSEIDIEEDEIKDKQPEEEEDYTEEGNSPSDNDNNNEDQNIIQEDDEDDIDEEGRKEEGGNRTEKSLPIGLDKETQTAKDIMKHLEKINTCFNNTYKFPDTDEAEVCLRSIASTFTIAIDEMYTVARIHNLYEIYEILLKAMADKFEEHKN